MEGEFGITISPRLFRLENGLQEKLQSTQIILENMQGKGTTGSGGETTTRDQNTKIRP